MEPTSAFCLSPRVYVAPPGIEPGSSVQETPILSVELRRQAHKFKIPQEYIHHYGPISGQTQANLEKFEVQNAKILKAELESLPLRNDSVNLVISNCTINHATDKPAVWSEVYRILKKGGRFVVSDIQPIADEYRNDLAAVAEC